jgi:hypothetical protein
VKKLIASFLLVAMLGFSIGCGGGTVSSKKTEMVGPGQTKSTEMKEKAP